MTYMYPTSREWKYYEKLGGWSLHGGRPRGVVPSDNKGLNIGDLVMKKDQPNRKYVVIGCDPFISQGPRTTIYLVRVCPSNERVKYSGEPLNTLRVVGQYDLVKAYQFRSDFPLSPYARRQYCRLDTLPVFEI